MEDSGQVLTGLMKVNKLTSSFQFEALKHVTTMIEMDPRYSTNFEAAVSFIQGQINSLRLKNGSSNRTVSAIESIGDFSYEEHGSEGDEETELQKLTRDLKQVKSRLMMAESKAKDQPAKKHVSYKFDKKDPGKYVPWSAWQKMGPEEREAVRVSRGPSTRAKGRGRRVSSLSTQEDKDVDDKDEGTIMIDSDDDSPEVVLPPKSSLRGLKQVPPGLLVPPHLLVSPDAQPIVTSRRNLHYASTKEARQTARDLVRNAGTRQIKSFKT